MSSLRFVHRPRPRDVVTDPRGTARVRRGILPFGVLGAVGIIAALLVPVRPAAAASDSWMANPASNTFTGNNWNTNFLIFSIPGTIAAGDSLFFNTSSVTTLNENEATGFNLGGFTFNAGASAFTIAGNAFTLSGGITNNSANLQTINDAITLSASQTVTTSTGGGDVTLGGAISGTGFGLTKAGAGTLNLSGVNTYTGATTVTGGTLNITAGSTGSASSNLLVQGSGTALNLTNATLTAGTTGIGYQTAGTSTVTVGVGGTLKLGNANGGGTGALVFIGGHSDGAGNAGNAPAGTGILTLNAGGAVNIAAAGTFPNDNLYLAGYGGTGTLNLNGGTLTTSRGIATGGTATLNFNGGTFQPNANNLQIYGGITAAVLENGAIFNPNGQTFSVNSGLVHGGAAATDGGLTVQGSAGGTLILNAAGTYNGGTILNAGTLALGNGSGAGTGAITLNAGTLDLSAQNVSNNLVSPAGKTSTAAYSNGNSSNGLTGTLTGSGTVNFTFTAATAVTSPNLPNFATFTGIAGVSTTAANVYPVLNQATGIPNATLNVTGTGGGFLYTNAAGTINVGALTGNGVVGGVYNGATTYSVGALNSSTTFSGVLENNTFAGTVALTKVGTGTLTLSGANPYSGATTVSGGTLAASGTGANKALGGTTQVTVNNGGTLLLGAANQINASAPVKLAGGTFNTGGFSQGGVSGGIPTAGLGALTLTATSTIDLGNGASILAFANSSGSAWTAGARLNIYDWSGNPGIGGGQDEVFFGNGAAGLTSAQLANIEFFSGQGTGDLGSAQILANGEIVPVPEPGTWAAAFLALGALGVSQRRRLRGLLSHRTA